MWDLSLLICYTHKINEIKSPKKKYVFTVISNIYFKNAFLLLLFICFVLFFYFLYKLYSEQYCLKKPLLVFPSKSSIISHHATCNYKTYNPTLTHAVFQIHIGWGNFKQVIFILGNRIHYVFVWTIISCIHW